MNQFNYGVFYLRNSILLSSMASRLPVHHLFLREFFDVSSFYFAVRGSRKVIITFSGCIKIPRDIFDSAKHVEESRMRRIMRKNTTGMWRWIRGVIEEKCRQATTVSHENLRPATISKPIHVRVRKRTEKSVCHVHRFIVILLLLYSIIYSVGYDVMNNYSLCTLHVS